MGLREFCSRLGASLAVLERVFIGLSNLKSYYCQCCASYLIMCFSFILAFLLIKGKGNNGVF